VKSLIVTLIGLAKTGALGKVFVTGGTMLFSVLAYSWVFGWLYAVGLVALILVHEMGHFVAARKRGLDVGAPTFIPFVGAWIQLKEMPHDAETEAFVGISGPIAGSIAAVLVYLAARYTGSQLLLALSYAGFLLNLFNLIPLHPFDGGRITSVISPKIWLVGVPILVALFLWRPSPLLVLVALLAAPKIWEVIRGQHDGNTAYYQTPVATRASYAGQYLGLVLVLAIMSFEVYRQLHPEREL
jgi:Zn-dependent protease